MTEPVGAWNWFSLAQELAREAGDEDLHALALARISRILVASYERPNPDAAIGVLDRILVDRLEPATRAMVAVHKAHAHAVNGNECAAMRMLGEAARAAERADSEETALQPWISANSSMYVANWAGTVQLQLARPEQAGEAWSAVLAQFPAQNVRARGELLLDLGKAALQNGEVAQSCQRAASAFDVFTRTNSKRHLTGVAEFRTSLAPYADTHAVRELDEYLHAC
jgi:hypothetical protein